MATDTSNTTASHVVRPAPIITVPNVPATTVTLRTVVEWADDTVEHSPRVVVQRGRGQATKVRIHRGEWT